MTAALPGIDSVFFRTDNVLTRQCSIFGAMGPELLLGLKDLFPQKRRDELVEIARFRAGHSRSYPRAGENGSPPSMNGVSPQTGGVGKPGSSTRLLKLRSYPTIRAAADLRPQSAKGRQDDYHTADAFLGRRRAG